MPAWVCTDGTWEGRERRPWKYADETKGTQRQEPSSLMKQLKTKQLRLTLERSQLNDERHSPGAGELNDDIFYPETVKGRPFTQQSFNSLLDY